MMIDVQIFLKVIKTSTIGVYFVPASAQFVTVHKCCLQAQNIHLL